MNKIYSIKSLVLLMVIGLFTGTVSAQNPSFTVSATVLNESIPANSFVEPTVDATNLLSASLTMEYELVSNTMDSGWTILICDNVNCYSNAVSGGTMDPIAAGIIDQIFKITLDPQGIVGSGSIAYRVWDRNNPSAQDTLTFNFETTPFVGVDEEQLARNVKVYPQPAEDLVYVSLPDNFGKANASIFSLSGAKVATQPISIVANEIDVTSLSPGMYILRIANDEVVVNKRIAVQ